MACIRHLVSFEYLEEMDSYRASLTGDCQFGCNLRLSLSKLWVVKLLINHASGFPGPTGLRRSSPFRGWNAPELSKSMCMRAHGSRNSTPTSGRIN